MMAIHKPSKASYHGSCSRTAAAALARSFASWRQPYVQAGTLRRTIVARILIQDQLRAGIELVPYDVLKQYTD